MGNTAIVLELLLVAISRASELSSLLQTASAQGRDVTDAEVATLRAGAEAAIDKLRG